MRVLALFSLFAIGHCQEPSESESLSLLQTAVVQEHTRATADCKTAKAAIKSKREAVSTAKEDLKSARSALKAARETFKAAKEALMSAKNAAEDAKGALLDACPKLKQKEKNKPLEGPISGVIVSEYDTYDGRFPAKNVLDSTWQGGSHNNGQTYLTRNCGGGWFVMQMQDIGVIQEFHILNTCNTPYNDRSAKDIKISLSSDNSNWENVLNYQMQRCTPIQGNPLVVPNPNPIKAQYIKVELTSCYGASAGLNYFQAFR
jgi:hypothetical protein